MSEHDGTPIFRVAFQRRLLTLLRRQHEACVRLIAEFAPDVIHLNVSMDGVIDFILQQRNCKRPALATLHDHRLFHNPGALNASLVDNVSAFAAVSKYLHGQTLACNPHIGDRLHTVLNALPMPAVAPAPLPVPGRILCFGRVVVEKGFDLAIEAFARLAPRFPGATLTVAGRGEAMESLQQLARETSVGDRIEFPGPIPPDEIPALINRHSIVIMPSRWQEPFGLAALQATQMGRPVIASRTGGLPEIIVDGVTGKFFENENLEALTQALQDLLEHPSLAEALGAEARVRAIKHFDFEAFVTAYEDLYRRIQR